MRAKDIIRGAKAATLVAAFAVAGPLAGPAHAQQFGSKECRVRAADGIHAEVLALGPTSCRLAMSAARKAARAEYPRRVVAWSSVTHRHYTLRRTELVDETDYFSAVYEGRGGIAVQIRATR